jgi:hypothetical protein
MDYRTRASAAELYAASRFAALGMEIAFPLSASSVADFVIFAPPAARVQVKTSSHRDSTGRLSVNLWTRAPNRRPGMLRADLYVIHDMKTEAWWVLPRDVVSECGRMTMHPQHNPYRDAWDLPLSF